MKFAITAAASAVLLALSGCMSTTPTIGDSGAKTVATGATAGAAAENANPQMERCRESLGTLAVVEDQGASWYQELRTYRLQSTVPVLRMLVQQSNCFVVVERGTTMRNMRQERALAESGEMRAGSNMGKGQLVAADYTKSPGITFSQKNGSGVGAALGGKVGTNLGALLGGGMKFNDASTMLTMIDNRSGVQLAAAGGSGRNGDFILHGGLLGSSAGGTAGAYGNTPEGKVIIAAFADSYNQMVRAVRNYRAQEVQGGLGTGGRLGVQGGMTPASNPTYVAPPPAAPAKKK